MKTLTEKEQLVKKLLENKSITFEECLLLLEDESEPEPIVYPQNLIWPNQPLNPTWWLSPPFTITC